MMWRIIGLIVAMQGTMFFTPAFADSRFAIPAGFATFTEMEVPEIAHEYAMAWAERQSALQPETAYAAWRAVAVTFAEQDTALLAYDRLWQIALEKHQDAFYQDFYQVRQDTGIYRNFAVFKRYQLAKTENTLAAYRKIMEDHPDSVEALQALLKIQELAFQNVQRQQLPELYDRFIVTFPTAGQVMQAKNEAYSLKQQQLQEKITAASYQQYNRLARELYNEARLAERKALNETLENQQRQLAQLTAERNYGLLEELFLGSEALSEHLSEKDTQNYRQAVMDYQQKHLALTTQQLALSQETQQTLKTIQQELVNINQNLTGMATTLENLSAQVATINENLEQQSAMQANYLSSIDQNLHHYTQMMQARMLERAGLRQLVANGLRSGGMAARFIPIPLIQRVISVSLTALANPVAELLFP